MYRLRAVSERMCRRAGASVLLLACVSMAACGSDESADSPSSARTVAASATVPDEPARSIADARRAADGEDYAAAVEISKWLPAGEARSVRRRIANRLAARALEALDAGDRGRARGFVIEGKDYPSTEQARVARATYKAAKAQAAEERRRNAEQRRVDEAMRQAGSMRPPPPMRMMPPSSMGMTPP
ncbi:MAG: hypothetical protein AVDCRST_MAG67-2879 [uncultured Solirubrobacteraceae bacterium]|uniref:DUF4398 domain-containing protein n=1 Tax=uncultured Solirubrobacteraceae bacterium TaxID=1162706 RepID=A0A6J4T328_9ACTN|nr:MAG: hypothetical protein AVDCRST_MAG67-2879 [uncultured Solirubrobacteraceae bacterium]